MKNEMAKDIVRAEGKIRYDAQCKKVLANKTILAWILKYTAEEFRDMEISEIRDCIEGEPEISSVRVEPGDTNRGKENRGEKITVVQVCLNRECKEHEKIESELTGMLNLLFDPTVGAEKKIKKLEEEYHMEMENRFGRELNQMCNFSDYVEELGIQKGMERGMRDGKILNAIGLIQKKIRKSKSLQEIADELEEQVEDIEPIYLLVKENPDKTENEILQMLVQKGSINGRAVDGRTTESN